MSSALFWVKIRSGVEVLGLLKNPPPKKKKTNKKRHPRGTEKSLLWGAETPKPDRYKILHAGCCPWPNHACQFWWRLVKVFWRGEGSNFGLFHWLHNTIAPPCECVIGQISFTKASDPCFYRIGDAAMLATVTGVSLWFEGRLRSKAADFLESW